MPSAEGQAKMLGTTTSLKSLSVNLKLYKESMVEEHNRGEALALARSTAATI
jgi:hypothetical protein